MLPKKNRVLSKQVEQIFKGGRFVNSSNLTLKYIVFNEKTEPQASFVVPKNIAKLAVKRNFLRRLGYNMLASEIKYLPFGFCGVFIFKKYITDKIIIKNEIQEIIHRIH